MNSFTKINNGKKYYKNSSFHYTIPIGTAIRGRNFVGNH